MQTIEIKTLIDVTNTGVKRPTQGTQQEADQYKNWITLNQCIELRGIISYDFSPEVELTDVKGLGFGKKYKGQHRVWTWRFSPDRDDIFEVGGDPLGGIVSDLNHVPVIKKLTETINIDRSVFDLSDEDLKNTTIRLISGNI